MARRRPRVPVLGHKEAWKHLPQAERGAGQPLPAWARALAATLPHTTAAMLELDCQHRTRSPLEPRLRGLLRWVAAHTNGCRYSEAYAAADLRRAGMDEASIEQLAGDLETTLPADTRAVVRFARKLTRDGSSVTDAEVAQLLARYGERQVVAMVLLLAHASFQDRLILALGLSLDSGEPLPPVDVRFVRMPLGASRAAPPRKAPLRAAAASLLSRPGDMDWLGLDFAGVQKQLAKQRDRRCRIALPGNNPDAPRWGLVCRTYQPELADAWSACAHAFGDEANQDPIFEESVFWIVTWEQRVATVRDNAISYEAEGKMRSLKLSFEPRQTVKATGEGETKGEYSGVYILSQDYLCISLNAREGDKGRGESSGSFILILRKQRGKD